MVEAERGFKQQNRAVGLLDMPWLILRGRQLPQQRMQRCRGNRAALAPPSLPQLVSHRNWLPLAPPGAHHLLHRLDAPHCLRAAHRLLRPGQLAVGGFEQLLGSRVGGTVGGALQAAVGADSQPARGGCSEWPRNAQSARAVPASGPGTDNRAGWWVRQPWAREVG